MEARELRIGNIVDYKGKSIVVSSIGIFGITSSTEEELIKAKFQTPDLNPVMLSEEMLAVNFGFKFNNEKRCYELKGISFFIGTTNVMCYVYGIRCKCDSVHQLQNLYFALTASDLELNK